MMEKTIGKPSWRGMWGANCKNKNQKIWNWIIWVDIFKYVSESYGPQNIFKEQLNIILHAKNL